MESRTIEVPGPLIVSVGSRHYCSAQGARIELGSFGEALSVRIGAPFESPACPRPASVLAGSVVVHTLDGRKLEFSPSAEVSLSE